MNIEKRTQEILESMTSCPKTIYRKNEVLPELFALQKELVALTFNEEHAELGNLKIWDVESHLTQMNEEREGTATDLLYRFKSGCKVLCNLIKAEISGNRGEAKAFYSLEKIRGEHVILKNINLSNDICRTELDAVVLTRSGAFIIEVKNTAKDIFIDESGDFYRTGEYMRLDCNIAQKMRDKRTLLEEVLRSVGLEKIKVSEILVFTNNQIEVRNRCDSVHSCFIGQLPFIIDESSAEINVTSEEMRCAAIAIESEKCDAAFPMDFDADQFKTDFATLMAKLEAADIEDVVPEIAYSVDEPTSKKRRKLLEILSAAFDSKYMKVAGAAAAVVVMVATTAVSLKNNY